MLYQGDRGGEQMRDRLRILYSGFRNMGKVYWAPYFLLFLFLPYMAYQPVAVAQFSDQFVPLISTDMLQSFSAYIPLIPVWYLVFYFRGQFEPGAAELLLAYRRIPYVRSFDALSIWAHTAFLLLPFALLLKMWLHFTNLLLYSLQYAIIMFVYCAVFFTIMILFRSVLLAAAVPIIYHLLTSIGGEESILFLGNRALNGEILLTKYLPLFFLSLAVGIGVAQIDQNRKTLERTVAPQIKKLRYGKYKTLFFAGMTVLAIGGGVLIYQTFKPDKTGHKVYEGESLVASLLKHFQTEIPAGTTPYFYFAERCAAGLAPMMEKDDSIESSAEAGSADAYLYFYYFDQMWQRFAPQREAESLIEQNRQVLCVQAPSILEKQPYADYTVASYHWMYRQRLCREMVEEGYQEQGEYYQKEIQELVWENVEEDVQFLLQQSNLGDDTPAFWERAALDRDWIYTQLSLSAKDQTKVLSYARLAYIRHRASELGLACPDYRGKTIGNLEVQTSELVEEINGSPSQMQKNERYNSPYSHCGIWPKEWMNF